MLWDLPLTPLIYTNGIPITRGYAGLRVGTKKEPCGSLCSLKIVKRVLQVDVEVVDVISEVLKQALVVLSLVLRHQRFKSGSDLQGAVKAFLLSHCMVVKVRRISPETIMACRQPSAASAQITVQMMPSSFEAGTQLYCRTTAAMARSIESRPLDTTTGL